MTDKTIIKVIDVSGTTPKVIPIKNGNYVDSDVTSVGVNAKEGLVVVASRSKKLITAAKVAPLANQHAFDLTDYRGVASFDVSVEYEDVTYVDEDWKVRVLDLGEGIPQAITQQPIARSGNGFWVRKGRRVVVTPEEKTGSRYRVALTDSSDAPQQVPGTGTPIKGTSAALGMGGSIAIAIDKSVFLAGTAGDSIGTGERLQLLGSDGRWTPIMGADGKPVWGSEVVTSMGFMAMKVRNESGKTVIGYATYGERIALPSGGAVAASDSSKRSNDAPYEPLKLDQDSTHFTHDEAQHEILKGFLDVNQDAINALEGVFGKDGARTKMVEMAINGLKAGKHEHLIDEFKRQSPLVPGKREAKGHSASWPVCECQPEGRCGGTQWRVVQLAIHGERTRSARQRS